MGAKIRTVLGDVSPAEVRAVVPHEHALLWQDRSVSREAYLAQALPPFRRRMRSEFRTLLARGCNCFVDCNTTGGLSIPEELVAASRATGMHVVTATGFYVGRSLPRWAKRASVDTLVESLLRDVREGIGGTTARAGALKAASNTYELSPVEQRTFCAVAQVHHETGVPITTHTTKGARAHVDFFRAHRVHLERVALGHIEVDPWEDTLAVARQGVMFLFTNFGGTNILPEDMVIAQIADLVRRGCVGQIMISVDMYLYYAKGRLRQRWPGGYVQLFDRVVPRLLKAGLKASHVDRIMHDNPVRHLAF
jgi:phosphotriesterase-related protein